MSVDIRDFRKHTTKAEAEKSAAPVEELLEQAPAAGFEVGDDKLDKLVRALEPVIAHCETILVDMQMKAMGCIQDEAFRACQLQFVYNKGKIDALKEVQALPKRIVHEAKLVS